MVGLVILAFEVSNGDQRDDSHCDYLENLSITDQMQNSRILTKQQVSDLKDQFKMPKMTRLLYRGTKEEFSAKKYREVVRN